MPDTRVIVDSIKRTLRLLVAATVVLYVVLGTVVFLNYRSSDTTNDALCALRGDLERRVEQSQQFLIEHPNGVGGIPAATIRQGLVNQQHTIHALRKLSC